MSVIVTFVGSGDAFGVGGRFQTCILVETSGFLLAIDFAATSLVALASLGIDHDRIDAVLLTRLAGDQCAGVPFLLLDAKRDARRERPLLIVGPRDCTNRLAAMSEMLYPGASALFQSFKLSFMELPNFSPEAVGPLRVTAYPADQVAATNPISVRIEIDSKVVAYTGDTAWNRHLPALAERADLFVAECRHYDERRPFHLDYFDIRAHARELTHKRMILVRLGRDMLEARDRVAEEIADDGLVIRL